MDELWKLESVELSESRQFISRLSDRLKTTRDPGLLGDLVEFYFKNGSKRARKVLTSLREAHSQDYFDKLHESLQDTSTRLPVLKLLAHTLNSETSWLYRVVDHPLFPAILDQLKTSVDIVVLCSGVFVVTAILPLVPSYIAPHLQDLFQIFCSLATIRQTKQLGLTPKELCLNLDVAVYYFFLQLYALFPNNFFQYLRTHYSQPDTLEQFNENIAPLFYQVQLHPSLVTGGSSYELSRRKWGTMEPDDIATLSLQLCLDKHLAPEQDGRPLPEDHHPHTGTPHTGTPHTGTSLTESHSTLALINTPILPPPHIVTTPSNSSLLTDLPQPAGLKTAEELDKFWSPLATLDSIIPHHSSNISPNDSSRNSITQPSVATSSAASPVSDSIVSSTLPTPRGTSASNLFTFRNYSPTASIDSDNRPVITQSAVHTPLEDSHGSLHFDPLSQSMRVESSTQTSPVRRMKRGTPNQSFKEKVGRFINGLFVAHTSKADETTRTSEEFTEIFASDADTSKSSNSTPSSPDTSGPLILAHRPLSEEVGEECLAESLKKSNKTSMDTTIKEDVLKPTSLPQSIPSSRSNSQTSEETTTPNQYYDLRGGCLSHPLSLDRTGDLPHPYSFSYPERGPTESIVVKRLRSSNSESNTRLTVLLLQERLQELVESGEGFDEGLSPDTSVITSTPVGEGGLFSDESAALNLDLSIDSTSTVLLPATPPTHTLSGPMTLGLNLVASPNRPTQPTATLSSGLASGPSNNANTLGVGLASRLFVKRVSVCSRIPRHHQFSDSSAESVGSESLSCLPTSNHPSPIALLDQYINRGVMLHKGHFETIPLTELEGVDWNHFGGCPHADESGMMQAQAVLLHSQLMFERYQCMQHARRNRTLLSQARGASKVAEEVQGLREQVQRQNEAVQSLQTDLQQRVCAHSNTVKLQENLRSRNQVLATENKQLKDCNLRLSEEVNALREGNQQLQKTLDHSNDKIVTLENDHSQLNTRLEHAETLKREVELLSRELQVLGDLYQQQKERTNTLLSHTSSELEATTLCTALVRERDIAEARSVGVRQEVGVLSARVRELEALLERRDNEGSLLRGQLERTEGQWGVKIKALEDKYKSMKAVGLQLENHILEMKGRTPLVKRRRHKRSISHPTEALPPTQRHPHRGTPPTQRHPHQSPTLITLLPEL